MKAATQIKNGHFVMCIHVLGQRNHLFCTTNTQMRHFRVKPLQTFAVQCPTIFCLFVYPCIGAKTSQPHSFWFYAITHAARMMNANPGKFKDCLASPFLLVHGVGHDVCTWIPLFYLSYFCHKKDGDQSCLKHQVHTMDGVIIGRLPTSNMLLVYNPQNRQYYKPDSYRIDSYQLPGLVYPDMKYDGGLFCLLLSDDNPSFEEKYPSGIRVDCIDQATNMLLADTVMDIPIPTSGSGDELTYNYMILFDNGTSVSIFPLRWLPLFQLLRFRSARWIHKTLSFLHFFS
jgi:hypothetical protein